MEDILNFLLKVKYRSFGMTHTIFFDTAYDDFICDNLYLQGRFFFAKDEIIFFFCH